MGWLGGLRGSCWCAGLGGFIVWVKSVARLASNVYSTILISTASMGWKIRDSPS